MTDRMNQIPRTSREGDHHLPRRGDPNFSTSQPYSSHGNTHTGTHLQHHKHSSGHESPSRDLRHVAPTQAHHCKYRLDYTSLILTNVKCHWLLMMQDPQQRQTASGHNDHEVLKLPQMDNDLSGLTRDLQSVHVSSSPQHSHLTSPSSHHSSPGHSIPRKPVSFLQWNDWARAKV